MAWGPRKLSGNSSLRAEAGEKGDLEQKSACGLLPHPAQVLALLRDLLPTFSGILMQAASCQSVQVGAQSAHDLEIK